VIEAMDGALTDLAGAVDVERPQRHHGRRNPEISVARCSPVSLLTAKSKRASPTAPIDASALLGAEGVGNRTPRWSRIDEPLQPCQLPGRLQLSRAMGDAHGVSDF